MSIQLCGILELRADEVMQKKSYQDVDLECSLAVLY